MNNISIRNAERNEIQQIRKHRLQAYYQHSKAISKEHWQALQQGLTSNADSQEGVEVIIAEKSEKLIGSVVLFPPKSDAYERYVEALDYPEIRMLAVSEESRGQGVATLLMEECIRRCKAKGYTHIGLHTGEFMRGAIKLYEMLGFKRLPKYDFIPANDGVVVRAYLLEL